LQEARGPIWLDFTRSFARTEKRLRLFHAVRNFLLNFQTRLAVEIHDITELGEAAIEAEFLLNSPTVEFLNDIRSSAIEHWRLRQEIESLRNDRKSDQRLIDEISRIDQKLVDALTKNLKSQFLPYLALK
jgi:hypothetical protein